MRMTEEYTIPLSRIIKELSLREVHMPKTAEEILIVSRDVIRPGLELYGFCDYFDPKRITVLGRSEMAMLESLGEKKKAEAIDHFFALRPATVIVARDIDPCGYMTAAAERYDIPLLSSRDSTSNVVADLVSLLNVELAPRITRHGVLVEVYGEGILLVGDSGVGKSETAIELVKRGHRLIADDAVEIRRVSSKSLVGTRPGEHPPLHRAARHRHHQRPAHLRHGRRQDDREDRHDHQPGALGRQQDLRPHGHRQRVHRNPGHPGAGD